MRFGPFARVAASLLLAGCATSQPAASGRSPSEPALSGSAVRALATAPATPTAEPTPEPTPTAEPSPVPTTLPLVQPGRQPATPVAPVAAVSCPAPANPPRPSFLASRGAGTALRPVVVVIDNAIPARPALNLSQADTVYEYVAEGGVTRFSAVYTKEDPGTIGPVRSARLVSLEVARQFEALLVYHGASTGVQNRIWNGGVYFVSLNEPPSANIHGRLNDRPGPHNSISRLPDIRTYARGKGIPSQVEDWPDFYRGDVSVPPSGTGGRVSVGFAGPGGAPTAEYRAEFTYLPEKGHYVRSTGGRPDVDGATRQPISAETVVVQVAPIVVTDIVEDIYGSLSLDYQLQGEGRAYFFRDGKYWEGCWRRPGAFEPTTYVGPDGKVFPLAKGQTWIALASPTTPIWRE